MYFSSDLTVRFLVSGTGTGSTELFGFLSSGIRDKEGSVVRDQEVLKYFKSHIPEKLEVSCFSHFFFEKEGLSGRTDPHLTYDILLSTKICVFFEFYPLSTRFEK